MIYVGVVSGWQNQEECAHITSTDFLQTVSCRTDKPVRYLTIRHQTESALTLCEVIVNGYKYQGKLINGLGIFKQLLDNKLLLGFLFYSPLKLTNDYIVTMSGDVKIHRLPPPNSAVSCSQIL